ncbi:hypothetical protein R5R35_002609 [Gryllus longicercus]|uniref:Peptidase S1 domain-containing protein n=1 Tax=Gryllus longicercus TaxID=2509291 RepID=A0AAN9YZW8_9ORTH
MPTLFTEKGVPYSVVHLKQPANAEAAAAAAIRNVSSQPLLQAAPSEGAGAGVQWDGGRILNGAKAEECQFPHQVAFITNFNTFCGGSLIGARWVLTAAHCVFDNAQWILVLAGSANWASAPVQAYAARGYLHGDYNASYLVNDVALLDLGADLPLDDCLQPVDLETQGCDNDDLAGEQAVTSGWGYTSGNTHVLEDWLQYVDTEIVRNEYCLSFYGNITVADTTVCSVSPVGASGTLCGGDSGGPLVWQATGRQMGINSFVASRGCTAGWPSGYARVPCFVQWIEAVQAL